MNKLKNKKLIIGIAATAILIIGAGILALLMTGGTDRDKQPESGGNYSQENKAPVSGGEAATGAGGSEVDPERGQKVSFADPEFEILVRATLGKREGDIWSSETAKITSLEANDYGIERLDDVKWLTQLTQLDLGRNHISDISPLAGLTQLTQLDLRFNNISDISPLAGLTKLTKLSLWSNQVSDISPLAGLTQLTHLYLASNQISDISPLAGLKQLTELDLVLNNISDWSPVGHVPIVIGRP